MSTLQSIIDVSQTPPRPPATLNGVKFGWQYPLPAPASEAFTPKTDVTITDKSPTNPRPGSYASSKKTGAIIMTDYRNSSIVESHLVAQLKHELMVTRVRRAGTASACTVSEKTDMYTYWTEQGDISSWSNKVSVMNVGNVAGDADIVDAIAQTRTASIAASRRGYDILTEWAERKSTARFFRDTTQSIGSTLNSFVNEDVNDRDRYHRKSTAKALLSHGDDIAKRYAGRWLAFRYALMPLIYSYQDILEEIRDRGNLYNTERSAEFWNYLDNEYTREGVQVINLALGGSKVSSVVKSMLNTESLERVVYNGLTVNPFNTAWELIPFSFIVDWFVNVGDYIMANLGADLSATSVGCSSVKHDYEVVSILSRKHEIVTGSTYGAFGSCDPGGIDTTYTIGYDEVHPLSVRRVRSYERVVFEPSGGTLVVNPDITWKRYVDSVAISYLLSRKKMRSYLK